MGRLFRAVAREATGKEHEMDGSLAECIAFFEEIRQEAGSISIQITRIAEEPEIRTMTGVAHDQG